MNRVYMDNAATTPVSPAVLEKMLPYFSECYGNANSIHSTGLDARKALNAARKKVAAALNCNPEEVYFTSGGSESDNWALKGVAFANRKKGNHIITSAIEHHAILHTCEWLEKQGFEITYVPVDADGLVNPADVEAAITDKTKCLMLNNPSNPTGMIYSAEELRAIADVCVKHDLYILADEIYYQLIYDGIEFTSIASLGEEVKERTLLINGVSKSYAMTGWRVGYCAANKTLAKIMSNFLSHSTGAPSTISQWASVEALTGPQEGIEAMRLAFLERRDYIVKRINSIPGVSCIVPNGAFYVMMNIEQLIGKTLGGKLIENDDDFAVALLEKALVAVVPCSGFGMKNFVRWSYAASMENIEKGLDRLEKFVTE